MIDLINEQELLNHIEYDNEDVVFLSGSLIEGIGNANSDLDVFVLYKDISKLKISQFDIDTHVQKLAFKTILNVGVDIEYWEFNDVLDKIEMLNGINFDDTNTNLSSVMDIRFLSFIHRIKVGKCINNSEAYHQILNNIRNENYFRYKIRLLVNCIENMYEDIIGNYNAKRFKTSIYIARKTLIDAGYAYLLHKGISLDRDKWVILHFERIAEDDLEAKELFTRFEKIMFRGSDNLEIETEQAIILINDIVDLIQDSEGGL